MRSAALPAVGRRRSRVSTRLFQACTSERADPVSRGDSAPLTRAWKTSATDDPRYPEDAHVDDFSQVVNVGPEDSNLGDPITHPELSSTFLARPRGAISSRKLFR